jgi:cell division protease FtsH
VFLGNDGSGLSSRPFAEATQAAIDAEVARLLREAEAHAVELLRGHLGELSRLVDQLLEAETVNGETVYQILGVPVPQRGPETTVAPRRPAAVSGAPAGPPQSRAAPQSHAAPPGRAGPAGPDGIIREE